MRPVADADDAIVESNERNDAWERDFVRYAQHNLDHKCVSGIAGIQIIAGRRRCQLGDGCYEERHDMDNDGRINVVDIPQVAAQWGWSCP
jgi:hypothetical protein